MNENHIDIIIIKNVPIELIIMKKKCTTKVIELEKFANWLKSMLKYRISISPMYRLSTVPVASEFEST